MEKEIRYTHDRHNNIVEIDINAMDKDDLINYASFRPMCKTKVEMEEYIESNKPIRVDTWTWPNDFYYE